LAHASSDTAPATALRVVVVDDSQMLRTRVRLALERAGLTVVGEAADGAQALTQAAAHHPDVVLMDLRMPRMDGIQAHPDPAAPAAGHARGAVDRRRRRPARQRHRRVGGTRRRCQGDRHGPAGRHLARGCDAQNPTRPNADGRDGGADPRPVNAAAPPAHASASLGSYLEQSSSGAVRADRLILQRHRRPEPPAGGLGAAERAALEQLEAAHGYATRWPVGRQITRSLVKRQLVVVASDYVLLTEAGRRALTIDSRRQSRSAPPDPGRADCGGPTRPAAG
jgi:hypothetical protein